MYIVGENPLLSEPDLHHAEKALDQLDFLVVQDLFLHETAERAHVFLPAAAFAEKDGTFTNSERRVQRVRRRSRRRARPAPTGGSPASSPGAWRAASACRPAASTTRVAAEIFDEMAACRPSWPGSPTSDSSARAASSGPAPRPITPARAFSTASPSRGAGPFMPVRPGRAAAELPDADYPFVLNTGRLLYHWHGGTLTRRVQGLLELAPRLEVAVNPADARRLGRGHGRAGIRVVSRRGELTGHAHVTEAVRTGSDLRAVRQARDSAANFLTNSASDPVAKIPEYKVCAVRLEPAG